LIRVPLTSLTHVNHILVGAPPPANFSSLAEDFMEKLIRMIKRRRSLILASAFAPMCFGMLIGGVGSSQVQRIREPRPHSPITDNKTINKTTTLDVVLVTKDEKFLIVRLKNISSKDLNGYVIAITNQSRITTDMSPGNRVVPPDETEDMQIPRDASPMEIVVLAAMFADGSIEGEPVTVEETRQWRMGLKEELSRSLPVLDSMLKSPETMALNKLTVHSDDSEIIKGETGSGIRTARENLNSEIRLLQERLQHDGTFTQKEALIELRKRLERRIASL
jgi:hypothetical protein